MAIWNESVKCEFDGAESQDLTKLIFWHIFLKFKKDMVLFRF